MIPFPTIATKLLIGASALLFAVGAGWHYRGKSEDAKRQKENAERLATENAAIIARIKNNERLAEQEELDRQRLKKGYANEIAKLRATYASSERLRINARLCNGAAVSSTSEGSSGSNGGTAAARVLPEDTDRDLKSLGQKYEEALTSCRVAQKFIRENGMAP